jgi:hypothetical protein
MNAILETIRQAVLVKQIESLSLRLGGLVLVSLLFGGCQLAKPQTLKNRPPARPIDSVRIERFTCGDEVVGEAVRNVFVEMFVRRCDVRVVTEGDADIAIAGTVTFSHLPEGQSGVKTSVVVGNGNSVQHGAVSGITGVARRGGEILSSGSWSYPLERGEDVLPPETVAKRAADRLIDLLEREGLRRR